MTKPIPAIPLPEAEVLSEEKNHNPYIVAAILALSIVVLLFYRLSGAQLSPGEPPTVVGMPNANSSTQIVVDIGGAVVRPGVYRMRKDSRVFDAIASAGGFSANADKSQVNMAMKLKDEMKIVVPAVGQQLVVASQTPAPSPEVDLPPGELQGPDAHEPIEEPEPEESLTPAQPIAQPAPAPAPMAPLSTPKPTSATTPKPVAVATPKPAPVIEPSQRLSLNRAQADELASLPGMNAKLAQEIINYRKGPPPHAFTSIDELAKVPGFKDKAGELAPYLKL